MNDYLATFQRSFERALGNTSYNRDFIGRFYELFLAESEDIAALFENTSMSAQKTMLHDSLTQLVAFNASRRIDSHLRHVARVHGAGGIDVADGLYDVWLDCLLRAVGEFDPEYDDSVELSWRLVLAPGICYMRFMRERDPGTLVEAPG